MCFENLSCTILRIVNCLIGYFCHFKWILSMLTVTRAPIIFISHHVHVAFVCILFQSRSYCSNSSDLIYHFSKCIRTSWTTMTTYLGSVTTLRKRVGLGVLVKRVKNKKGGFEVKRVGLYHHCQLWMLIFSPFCLVYRS